jgi:hypothetical protein
MRANYGEEITSQAICRTKGLRIVGFLTSRVCAPTQLLASEHLGNTQNKLRRPL